MLSSRQSRAAASPAIRSAEAAKEEGGWDPCKPLTRKETKGITHPRSQHVTGESVGLRDESAGGLGFRGALPLARAQLRIGGGWAPHQQEASTHVEGH